MRASILTIGNELLIGDIINTNAAWIGTFLTEHDIEPVRSVTVGDSEAEIVHHLRDCAKVSELIIITGGLGPTHDDVTKHTLLRYTGGRFTEHTPTREFIEYNFKKRGIPISKSNLGQAQVPDTCEVLFNKAGTAPGMWFEHEGCILVSLPGVPVEMKYLMEKEVWPRLAQKLGTNGSIFRHYMQTAGIGESTLSDIEIGDVSDKLIEGVQLAFLPHSHGVGLRISSTGGTTEEARAKALPLIKHIRSKAREHIYSEVQGDDLPAAVGRLLEHSKKTIATAESCTGGLLGSMITDVPGSSGWYNGSIVAYQNELKTALLDVPESVLKAHGAVSAETALIMAKSAAEKLGAGIGLSTTGIAGPGGGSAEKPVGLVWFGYYDGERHFAMRAQFFKNRKMNKERTALVALDITRRVLTGVTRMPYDAPVVIG